MLADIVSGELDWADIFFLVAFVVFVVAAVLNAMTRDFASTLAAVGFALLSLGWLVL